MFNLWGKIRLDGAEAKRDAAKAGTQLSKDFGQQFKSGVLRFVGAGALISLAQRQVQQAVEISRGSMKTGTSVEAFQELSRGAELLGISVEELQKVAPQIGQPFADFMAMIRERGGILDEQAVNALLMVSDAFARAASAMAPVISFATDWAGRLYRFGKVGVEGLVGLGTEAVGFATGDPAMRDAGAAMVAESYRNQFRQLGTPTSVGTTELTEATRKVADEVRRLREDQNKNAGELKQTLSP